MILILAEKPSAARNFAKALGGASGTYNGEAYKITASHGHLYEYTDPDKMVSEPLSARYRSWDIGYLPWNPADFNWKKTRKTDSADTLSAIKSAAAGCDEICIATDDDPTGEGEMLAWEIISGLKLKAPKYTRMYFEDETPSSVQKAFIGRKYLGNSLSCMYDDPDYKKADVRSKWDFLSMQWTRIAKAAGDGKAVLRQGRLKSAMVSIVGDQLKLIDDYVPVPYYQNRFRDENGIVYINKKEPTYPNKEDVPQKYHSSPVVMDESSIKHTAPPKPLDLASLSARLAPKGFRSSEVLSVYQKMYEDHIVSYPRTEDKFVSPDQFRELLPYVDKIATVIGVDPSLLTVRKPRATHVKTGGTHGANRPGTTVPSSLSALDSKYGKCASAIYDMLARNYLAMLAPDYEYEQQKGHPKDYPPFIGIANIPKSKGWKAIYDDDSKSDNTDDGTSESTLGLGKTADPFIYEGVNPKPTWPTMKWLMKQLEKADVGTGATRTSIYAEVTNDKASYPLLKDTRGKITMTEYGTMSYKLLKDTRIGDLKITEKLMQDMRAVGAGSMTEDTCLNGVADMIIADRDTMLKNGSDIAKTADIHASTPRWTGTWNGKPVSFKRIWGGHTFTDEECEALCEGKTITIQTSNDSGTYGVTGKLAEQSYKGSTFVGFQKDAPAEDSDHYVGKWKNKPVRFKRVWSGHTFTDEECEALCAGKSIWIDTESKLGPRKVCGKLAKQSYNGSEFVGFQRDESIPPVYPADANRYNGTWDGKPVSFKRIWGGHTFTDDECEALCKGETITFTGVSSSGSTYSVSGLLALQSYNGTPYIGFKRDDTSLSSSGSDAERYSGTWKGRAVRFKRQWGSHRFTDSECQKLCDGKSITFTYHGTSSSFKVTGRLAEQEYNGHAYVGFKKDDR